MRAALDNSKRQRRWEAPINTHTHTHTAQTLLAAIVNGQKRALLEKSLCSCSSKVLTDNYRLWLPWQYVSFFQAMLLTTMFNNMNKAKERPHNRPLAIAFLYSPFPKNGAFSLSDFKRPSYKNIIECSEFQTHRFRGALLAGAEGSSNSFSCYCATFFYY